MPPTDEFDGLVLMRCRAENGSSSPTSRSASRRSHITGERRSPFALPGACGLFAEQTRRRGAAESQPARERARREARRASQQRRGAVEPQRLAFEEPRQPVAGVSVEDAQTQVLAEALVMFGDRLLATGVGVDCLRVGSQLQGGAPQDLLVDLQWRLPGNRPSTRTKATW